MTKERFDERKSTQQQLNRETKVYLLLPFEKVTQPQAETLPNRPYSDERTQIPEQIPAEIQMAHVAGPLVCHYQQCVSDSARRIGALLYRPGGG